MAAVPPPHAPMSHLFLGSMRIGLFLLLIFFQIDHFFAFVMSATGTNSVGQSHLSAVGALHQVLSLQGIVSAAAITAASG